MTRALFVNAGILGHRSVARLVEAAASAGSGLHATHENLSDDLSTYDRVIRRIMCVNPLPTSLFGVPNLDFSRWRAELHLGVIAARRIRARERNGERFDVLHFHPQPCAYASIGRMRRTPSIVSIDCTQQLASIEVPSALGRLTYAPNEWHDGHVFRAARAIIATSRWAADDLARHYPDCADKVHVMAYPVRLEGFDPAWIEARAERARRGEPPRFLFVGGDFARKGGHDLLEAWAMAKLPAGSRLELMTAASFDDVTLPPGVEITRGVTAYTTAWYDAWRRADVFVMPTRAEAFGMVYQEASAAGLPVIATRLNAIPELVVEGRSALLVAPFSPTQVAVALEQLASDPELRRRMGIAAREKIARDGRPDVYAHRLRQVIDDVASSPTPLDDASSPAGSPRST